MKDLSDIDGMIGDLFHAVHITNPEFRVDYANTYYDVGEYGLALEELVGFFLEKSITPNKNVLRKITFLAERMNMREDSIVGKYLKDVQ